MWNCWEDWIPSTSQRHFMAYLFKTHLSTPFLENSTTTYMIHLACLPLPVPEFLLFHRSYWLPCPKHFSSSISVPSIFFSHFLLGFLIFYQKLLKLWGQIYLLLYNFAFLSCTRRPSFPKHTLPFTRLTTANRVSTLSVDLLWALSIFVR